jgi:peptidoglycan L-alanyl-D-glutamate endopeptidase CwlK
MYKWGAGSISRMEGINPQLVECATRALSKARYDYTIPWMGGLRTDREQHDIFKEGNSKCDGYEKKSYHQTGNAIDVIPVDKGYKNTRGLNYFANLMLCEWQIMKDEGKAEGIMTWGGTFGSNGWDKPHFEIRL